MVFRISLIDWAVIAVAFIVAIVLALYYTRRATRTYLDFFAAGKKFSPFLSEALLCGANFAWWTPGVSWGAYTYGYPYYFLQWMAWHFMRNGLGQNIVRMMNRTGVVGNPAIFEVRFGGKLGAWIRSFVSLYNYLLFAPYWTAIMILTLYTVAETFIGVPRYTAMAIIGAVMIIYVSLAGLQGAGVIAVWNWILWIVASIAMAIYSVQALAAFPSLQAALASVGKPNLLIFNDAGGMALVWIAMGIIATEYGRPHWGFPMYYGWAGGASFATGFAQRDEADSIMAWPFWYDIIWLGFFVLIAIPVFSSIALFPTVADPATLFPTLWTILPSGLLGIAAAALLLGVTVSLSDFLTWTPGFVVADVYRRFINPNASDSRCIWLNRILVVWLVIQAAILATFAAQFATFLLWSYTLASVAAVAVWGEWFWWRWNGWGQIALLFLGFPTILVLKYTFPALPSFPQLPWVAALILSVLFLVLAFIFPPPSEDVLIDYYRKVRPTGFWGPVREKVKAMERESGGGC